MFKFIIGMITGVVITIAIADVTSESEDNLDYDSSFDDYYDEEEYECDDEIVE